VGKINIDIKRKKIIALIAITVILIALTLLYLWKGPYHSRIEMTFTALMVSGKNMDVQEVEITVKGEYTRYIIPNDYYQGNFIINGFYVSESIENIDPFPLGKNVRGNLYYSKYRSSKEWVYAPFGQIIADKKFKSFVIIPWEEYIENPVYNGNQGGGIGFNGDTITVIVYPAETREEAIKIANEKLIACFGENLIPMK
jgi:hypothetical protein